MSDYNIQGWPINLQAQKVTILSGASVSEMISTQGKALVAVVMPTAWTAAGLAFKGCLTGNPSDLFFLYDAGGNPEGTPAAVNASTIVMLPSSDALFVPFLQLVSVTAGSATPVAQNGDRTLILLYRNYLN